MFKKILLSFIFILLFFNYVEAEDNKEEEIIEINNEEDNLEIEVTNELYYDDYLIKLSNVYNSAHGADLRFKKVEGFDIYTIMRKTDGVWKDIKTVHVDELEKEGQYLKYIDREIKDNYGKGYIYSIAVDDNFDKIGIGLYRLRQPNITSLVVDENNNIKVTWEKVEAHGYELQYKKKSDNNWIKLPETTNNYQVVTDLKSNTEYVFKLRCQKTNPDRGKGWSQYSSWKSIKTNKSPYLEIDDMIIDESLPIPKLVAIYNSAKGADLRFKEVEGFNVYMIMRKENGVWRAIDELDINNIEKVGNNLKYIDNSVKDKYGKGYIYSVRVVKEDRLGKYDTLGLGLYRLKQPTIQVTSASSYNNIIVHWSKEDAHGYELQFKGADYQYENISFPGINYGEIGSIHYAYVYNSYPHGPYDWESMPLTTETNITIPNLDEYTKYNFRVRSYKENKDRGRTYSQYSEWYIGIAGFKPYNNSSLEDPYLFVERMNKEGAVNGYRYCENFAYAYTSASNYQWEEVTNPQFGDFILYYKADGTYAHTAVYLWDGLAIHGNYMPNHEARVAKAQIYSYQRYFRPKYQVVYQ